MQGCGQGCHQVYRPLRLFEFQKNQKLLRVTAALCPATKAHKVSLAKETEDGFQETTC